jgi:hypothetical protein
MLTFIPFNLLHMNQPGQLQHHLFDLIKAKLDPNISFVHDLSELLGISYDSAYRRIRGEKELSLEEVKSICFHYDLSMDTLLNIKSRNVIFNSLAIGEDNFGFADWLKSLLVMIKEIHACRQKEIIYAAKDLPFFYYFEFPEIAAFKIYFWHKTLIPSSEYQDKLFTLEPPEDIYRTGLELLAYYMKIPTIEIWSEETMSSVLRQVEYCFISGFFQKKEDIFRLCDVMEDWLNHIRQQAEYGFKFKVGTTPEGIPDSYKLFNNEVLVTDNTIFVTMDGQKASYYTYNVINQLITTNPVFCGQVENTLRNLMKNSSLISGTSAKERNRFFNILHDKIRTLKTKIERIS